MLNFQQTPKVEHGAFLAIGIDVPGGVGNQY